MTNNNTVFRNSDNDKIGAVSLNYTHMAQTVRHDELVGS